MNYNSTTDYTKYQRQSRFSDILLNTKSKRTKNLIKTNQQFDKAKKRQGKATWKNNGQGSDTVICSYEQLKTLKNAQ